MRHSRLDLSNRTMDCDGEIHMYADDTKVYVTASSPDMVAVVLNVILRNCMTGAALTASYPTPVKPSK